MPVLVTYIPFSQGKNRPIPVPILPLQDPHRIKTILTQECQTIFGLAPPGATSKIQPLDVAFNAEFKKNVDRLITGHFFAYPELFMSGKVSAGDRRLLFTKWVGKA